MMMNIHQVNSEVNESVIILHIKPHIMNNSTLDVNEITFFAFMNKGN